MQSNRSVTSNRPDAPTGIGWVLWVALAALPWLQPVHEHPWPAFYSELLAALAAIPIVAWVLWIRRRDGWLLEPVSGTLLLVAAVIPLLQVGLGLYLFPAEAWLASLYLGGMWLTVLAARNAEESKPLVLADALFAAIAVASLASTGVMLYQWLGQDWLSMVVHAPRVAGRVNANLGQPNNLATLLCWGLVAIWWGLMRGKLGRPVALSAAAFLLLGVALTRSRTGWVEVALLAAVSVYWARRRLAGPGIAPVVALGLAFMLTTAGLDHATNALQGGGADVVREQSTAGKRPMIWHLAIDEIADRPWLGYGWNQGVVAHMQVAERYPELRTTVQHAHNVALDLLVWNGVPIGLALIVALGYWALRQWTACQTDPQRLLLLALALLAVHASLELPHAYLFFLLPAAMMIGTLDAMAGQKPTLVLPSRLVALVAAALSAAVVVAFNDYRSIEQDLMAAKMRAANIYNPDPAPPARPLLLRHLQTALEHLRLDPSREVPTAQLVELRKTLQRYPSSGGLIRYAHASALHRQPEEARWALERLCLLNPKPLCDRTLSDWRDRAQSTPELAAVNLPDVR